MSESKDRKAIREAAMTKGIGIGLVLGAAMGIPMDNLAIGMGIGVALGAGLGQSFYKKELAKIEKSEN